MSKTVAAKAGSAKSTTKQRNYNKKKQTAIVPEFPVKVIPIGGLNEIGKNMTVLEYKDEIIIIDCGMSFPDDEMFGIDIVIPDFTYLIENKSKVKGLIITHGHEDHIGAVPYLLKQINVPVFGTRLVTGLIESKLKEHGIQGRLNNIKAGDRIRLGSFDIETIRTTHSIADSICLSIDTPAGRIFHTGDFKIDYTPIDGEPIDFRRLAEIGREGVDILMADSTNATRPGYTASERVVGQTLETIFMQTESRIIIATFSSNVHRVQKIIDNAVLCNRKVAVSGRSMVNVVNLAIELGYLKVPANVLVDINKLKGIPDKEIVIITTGSQGEPMSALSRMASNDHKAVQIREGDTVILSSNPIPGNEKTVANVVNKLFERGAKVIYSDIADIHVSGHACQEELKLMHSLIKPKYFVPVHGEYRHLKQHGLIAESLGLPQDHIFIISNGDILSYKKNHVEISEGVVPAEAVLVDGLGVGDVGNIVLRDRKMLSESGLIVVVAAIDSSTGMVVSGPDIISRGFIYVRENEELVEHARKVAELALEECMTGKVTDWNAMKQSVREALRRFIFTRTGRSPIILPIFLDV
ncbi:MAG: ribonuclease J [Clostridiales bacterium]|nr:ribonuclease J [Clostridiales bacterium]